eukprot:CAMPEP_0113881810 /NCGR_PEP_ID=MMETSP0780_2-20120614/8588_1 /TAXON_ID=652834 /ORGANISM="Palpitomonas bilix" /LENGTH=140 /DNA_ID=CAMNT_0000868719 /DNA_START=217 /DNA_END=636 /DNA_ORIENTATION=+ /assembly_acc=CAM_ASM_000599
MSLVGGGYDSDSDIDDMFADEPEERTTVKRSSLEGGQSGSNKKQKKLPSASELLSDWVPPEEELEVEEDKTIDKKGTRYNQVAPPTELLHSTIRESYESVTASKAKAKKREAMQKKTASMVPPQLKGGRKNTVTEDYSAW